MSKNKKILMILAKGGTSQSDIAAALHVSKRDVSAGAKAIREYGLTFDAVSQMDADAVDDLFFPKEEREPNGALRTVRIIDSHSATPDKRSMLRR